MAQNNISFDTFVSINDLRRGLPVIGSNITAMIMGEPGCGKSSLLPQIAADNGDAWRRPGDVCPNDKFHYVYVDCPLKDVGDIAVNIPVHNTKSLEQYISAQFPRDGKPIVVMLDELLKANKLLKIMFTRLMLERTVGDWPLPDGSIVFATSNNQSDGLNDIIEGHVGNRVSIFRLAKPSPNEWLQWAGENGVNAVVRAWVHQTKECLRSYLESGQDENPYIFNPSRASISFVSPRSLKKASDLITSCRQAGLSDDFIKAGLAGTLGASAAENMAAFLMLEKELVAVEDVLKNPAKVKVPEKPAAIFMMMFNALDAIETQDDLSNFMVFLDRIGSREVESVFFTMLVQNKRTIKLVRGNTRTSEWARRNIELF